MLEYQLRAALPQFTPRKRPTDVLKQSKRENRVQSVANCLDRADHLWVQAKGYVVFSSEISDMWLMPMSDSVRKAKLPKPRGYCSTLSAASPHGIRVNGTNLARLW